MIFCYNCGVIISKRNKTREHIPAQNLFVGFGNEYKKNRIVVPSCFTCNQSTSILDEEFRNLIGAISNDSKLDPISKNTARGIINYKQQFDRLRFDNLGRVIAVTFDENHILNNHIKIFKGLYYNQYKHPISKEYKIVSFYQPDELTGECINYLTSNFDWKYSGHPDIFSYILQPFREKFENTSKKDLIPIENEQVYMSIQKFNNSHAGIVIATFSISENTF